MLKFFKGKGKGKAQQNQANGSDATGAPQPLLQISDHRESSTESATTIYDLPLEIIFEILSYLPIADVRNFAVAFVKGGQADCANELKWKQAITTLRQAAGLPTDDITADRCNAAQFIQELEWATVRITQEYTYLQTHMQIFLATIPLDNPLRSEISTEFGNLTQKLKQPFQNIAHIKETGGYLDRINTKLAELQIKEHHKYSLRLTSLTRISDAFVAKHKEQLDALQEFDFSNNGLATLPLSLFRDSNVQVLKLTNNHFRTMPRSILHATKLAEIYLPLNKIAQLPNVFNYTPALRHIYLQHNYLSSLPETLKTAAHIVKIGLSNNVLPASEVLSLESAHSKIPSSSSSHQIESNSDWQLDAEPKLKELTLYFSTLAIQDRENESKEIKKDKNEMRTNISSSLAQARKDFNLI